MDPPRAQVPSLSVVLPAFNEEENIQPMLEEVLQRVAPLTQDLEVLVVDDGSRDATSLRVQALADGRVRLLRHERNLGYGAAVRTGVKAATKGIVFQTDSDRQFSLEELPRFLLALEGADVVIGYRSPRRDPLMRQLNGWGWALAVNTLFGYQGRDIDCAFKVFKRAVAQAVEVSSGGATYSAEFLIRARRAGFRVTELPVYSHRPRVAGSPTGARPAVVLRAFRDLFRLRWELLRPRPGGEEQRSKALH